MSRWPVLAVSSTMVLTGCAGTAGLANAPALGALTRGDEPVHDVVANGGDACGRHAERGPLRGHVPPCPTTVRVQGKPQLLPPPAPAGGGELVAPWLEHYYSGWPCARRRALDSRALAWSPPSSCPAPP
ncbi:MAG TPA: hypothetical protein VE987_15495 [Polyangiaceae bacterium]|nr:hypothetical protein [Polyangiaceae bacterium]